MKDQRDQLIFGAKSIISNAPSAMALLDKGMCYICASKKWLDDFNLGNIDITGRSHYELFPEIGEEWKTVYKECLSGKSFEHKENWFTAPGGNLLLLSWSMKPWLTDDNSIAGIIIYTEDITARRHTEEKLEESEVQFRLAFENSAVAMSLVDENGKWIEVNTNFCNLVGYAKGELLNHNFKDITHPDDLTKQQQLIQEVLVGQHDSYQMEKRVFHKKGHTLWLQISSSLMKQKIGNLKYFVSQVENITARKEAEKQLHEEKKLLRTVVDNLPLNIYIKDLNSKKTLANRAEYVFMGAASEAEVLNKDDYEDYPVDAAADFITTDKQVFESGLPLLNQEYLIRKKGGGDHCFLLSKIPLRDEDGTIKGLLGINYDITERKEFEKELLHTQNLLNQAEALANIGSIEINFITGKRKWSDEFYRILGLAPGSIEAGGDAFVAFLHPEDKGSYLDWFYKSVNSKASSANIETRIIRADGEIRNIYVYGIGIVNNNIPEKIFGVIQDITLKKKAEEKMLQARNLLQRAERIAHIGSGEVDYKTKEIIWSDELYRMLALEPGSLELTVGDMQKYIHPDDKGRYLQWLQNSLANKITATQIEARVIRADGIERTLMIYGSARYDEHGNPEKSFGVFKDITEDKKTLQELETSRQVYQSLFYQNPAAVFSVDLGGNFTSANHLFTLSTNLGLEKLLSLNFKQIISPNDADDTNTHFEFAKKGLTQKFEAKVVTGIGKIVLVSVTLIPITVDNIITGVYGIANDISETKRQESIDKLEKEIWEYYGNKKNTLDDIIFLLLTGLEKIHPDMLCSVLKLTEGKLYNWASPRLPKEYVDAIEGISASFGVGSCGTAAFLKEKVIVTDIDHDPLWKDYRELAAKFEFKACWSHPLIDSNQNVLGTFGIYYKTLRNGSPAEEMSIERARIILTSIIENKMAEEELWLKEKALKQSHELLEKLTDQVPAAIYQFKITPDGKMSFEFISSGVKKVIPGITPENMKENVLLGFSMLHPDDADTFRQTLFYSRDNLTDWNLEYRVVIEQRKPIWHKVAAHPEKKEDGSVVWYGYFQDVTIQKQQEQEREQLILELSQNNKDLRHFSYITSHNLRAPLSNLVGLVNLIDDMPVEDLIMAELLRGFKTSTLLLNDTVNDLLKVLTIKDNLSIKQEDIELEPIIEKVFSQIQLLIDSIKPEINFNFSECAAITFNKVYMESIFLNLITNAIKYRSPKRKLQIFVTSRNLGDCMTLTFADNGLGIDTERYKDRIFGLYQRFHNHPDSKGFGLYMVKSQMEALGGHIEIRSKVDEGTNLILTFKK